MVMLSTAARSFLILRILQEWRGSSRKVGETPGNEEESLSFGGGTAFGAIGTTIGSLTTAIAVVIAVKQYLQPLEKHIVVTMTSALSWDEMGRPLDFYCISVKNRGIREITVNSLNIKGRKKILWLNKAQYASNAYVELPIRIGLEEIRDFLFERNTFTAELKHFVEMGTLKANKRLTVMVKDSLGDEYTHKARIKIKDIIKNV